MSHYRALNSAVHWFQGTLAQIDARFKVSLVDQKQNYAITVDGSRCLSAVRSTAQRKTALMLAVFLKIFRGAYTHYYKDE